jgi:hypothetical protein
MKKTVIKNVLVLSCVIALFSSCTTLSSSMREPNMLVEFDKSDFVLTEQVTSEAETVKVLGIDWSRLFSSQKGSINPSGSVFGSQPSNKTSSYALYNLMAANPGYDVIFYPQYETYKRGGLFYSKTTVKTTAKLGKIAE